MVLDYYWDGANGNLKETARSSQSFFHENVYSFWNIAVIRIRLQSCKVCMLCFVF